MAITGFRSSAGFLSRFLSLPAPSAGAHRNNKHQAAKYQHPEKSNPELIYCGIFPQKEGCRIPKNCRSDQPADPADD